MHREFNARCGTIESNSSTRRQAAHAWRRSQKETDRHPEWVAAFNDIVSEHMAGLPQDEDIVWFDINVPQIRREFLQRGHDVSEYIVRQMIKAAGLKQRSFTKSLPLREVEDRDAQFLKINAARTACIEAGIPIISVDTKKKENAGNFKRDGQVYCTSSPKALDHDFETFSGGTIVPHGIYDMAHNTGYLSIGTGHDTSEFVCENIERVWNSHMKPKLKRTISTFYCVCIAKKAWHYNSPML